ncbi:MAG: M23 family metallopeptidase [Nitrospirae bacterium]|nr:M23 family metallopeptidase [Nitrospirota bacterium]
MDDRNRESYTVMILPNPTSKTYRFSVSKKNVKIFLSIACAAVIFLLVFVVQYFYMVGNIWELTSLRQETTAQKSKIEFFAQSVDGLKRQMERLKEFDVKLRMITDLNVPANASKYLGVGGETDTEGQVPALSAGPEGGEGGTEVPVEAPDVLGTPPNHQEALVRSLEEDLSTLQINVVRQEQSYQELTQAIEHRRNRWASTPSIWPVKGWMTSGFGRRISPFTGEPAMHRGVDISVPENTPMVASANGVVIRAGWDGGLGNAIKIDHGFGYATTYGHLAKIQVRVGQRVKRGQVIGLVGNTGLSTGPHLHYEVVVNLTPTNPLRYILN